MSKFRLPQNFEEWRHCIEVLCKTPLTESFVETRIEQLENLTSKLDRRFVEMYGDAHRVQVLTWYKQVKDESSFAA